MEQGQQRPHFWRYFAQDAALLPTAGIVAATLGSTAIALAGFGILAVIVVLCMLLDMMFTKPQLVRYEPPPIVKQMNEAGAHLRTWAEELRDVTIAVILLLGLIWLFTPKQDQQSNARQEETEDPPVSTPVQEDPHRHIRRDRVVLGKPIVRPTRNHEASSGSPAAKVVEARAVANEKHSSHLNWFRKKKKSLEKPMT
ncbi:hypothetical protein T439DRAFT_376573 [Meredithblackwellia eburnea MCA 4105]